jgi:hypothetical protein
VNSRRRKDTSLDLGGVRIDLEAVMAEIRVVLPVEQADTSHDSTPALLGESDGKFDHVGGLSVRQLGVVPLVGIDLEDVHRQVDRLFADLLGHLDDRYS